MGWEIFFANLEWLMIAMFVLGTILIAVEVIVPGFGIAGILGIVSLIFGVRLASNLVAPTTLVFMMVIILLVITFLVIWFYRSMTRGGKMSRTLVLKTDTKDNIKPSTSKEYSNLLEKQGKTLTRLRPTGTAVFDAQKIDVVTEGEFIEAGRYIEVMKVEGFKIIVREVQNHS